MCWPKKTAIVCDSFDYGNQWQNNLKSEGKKRNGLSGAECGAEGVPPITCAWDSTRLSGAARKRAKYNKFNGVSHKENSPLAWLESFSSWLFKFRTHHSSILLQVLPQARIYSHTSVCNLWWLCAYSKILESSCRSLLSPA